VILADTSVWIDHLRAPSPTFIGLLRLRLIAIHPYVALEVASYGRPKPITLRWPRSRAARAAGPENDDATGGTGIQYRTAEPLALGARVGEASLHAFDDDLALELGERADDVEEQSAHRRRRVDRLGMADEVDAEIAELLQGRDQRAERAREAIVFPHQHAIEAPSACVRHRRFELGRASASAHVPRSLVDVLAGDLEPPMPGIGAQLAKLSLRALLARRYARVDRHPRRHRLPVFLRALYCS